MIVDELFVALGFKTDTLKLKEFISALGELRMSSIASAVGVGWLYEATRKAISVATEASMSTWQFSEMTEISTKKTQQFVNVFEKLGVSVEEAKGSLSGLKTAMFEAQWRGGEAASAASLIGLTGREKDVFEQLRKRI